MCGARRSLRPEEGVGGTSFSVVGVLPNPREPTKAAKRDCFFLSGVCSAARGDDTVFFTAGAGGAAKCEARAAAKTSARMAFSCSKSLTFFLSAAFSLLSFSFSFRRSALALRSRRARSRPMLLPPLHS